MGQEAKAMRPHPVAATVMGSLSEFAVSPDLELRRFQLGTRHDSLQVGLAGARA